MATREEFFEFFDKANWIENAIQSIYENSQIGFGATDRRNIERIRGINDTSLLALKTNRSNPEGLGRLHFWALKKNINSNWKTIHSALIRHGIDPETISNYWS